MSIRAKKSVIAYILLLSLILAFIPAVSAADAQNPDLMITRIVPDTDNENGSDAYELIEVYNASGKEINTKGYVVLYHGERDLPLDKASKWSLGEIKVPAGDFAYIWVRNTTNVTKSVDDFVAYWKEKGSAKFTKEQVSAVNAGGMANSGERSLGILTPDGSVISKITYNPDGSKDTGVDTGILFGLPITDGRLKHLGSEEKTKPGTLKDGQVPKAAAAPATPAPAPAPKPAEPAKKEMTSVELVTKIGMLVGEGNGVTPEYLAKSPTRIQAAVMYLRLKGLESEATNFKGTDNFSDAKDASWAAPILAYVKAHPEHGMTGVGDNKFDPNANITAQAYYKIMLEALGYKYDVDFKWDNTIQFAASLGLNKAANASNFTLANLADATAEALQTNVKGTNKTLLQTLVDAKVIDAALLK